MGLAVAIVAVLVGDGIAVVVHGGDGEADAVPVPAQSPLARALPRLEAFVEETRGLRFKRRVPVELLSADAFTERLRDVEEPEDQAEADAEAFESFLRVLGLVAGGVDLATVDESIEEHGILGFYDPDEEALYVRGASLWPF